MSDWQDFRVTDFTQGYVDKVDDTELPTGALKDCRNMISRQIGRIVSRNGQKKLNTTELGSPPTGHYPVQGLAAFYGTGIKYLLAVANGVVYFCTPPATTMTAISGITLSTTAPVQFVPAMIEGKPHIVGLNGVNAPFKWDGTTASNLKDYRAIIRETAPAVQQSIATIVVPSAVTAGNISVVVTAAGMTGSPATLTVAVADDDTASQVATKIRTAMSADAGTVAWCYVTGTAADVVLIRKVDPDDEDTTKNDATMNIAVTGAARGITDIVTSTNITKNQYKIFQCESTLEEIFPLRTNTADNDYIFVWTGYGTEGKVPSSNTLVDDSDYTVNSTDATITFDSSRLTTVSSKTTADAATTGVPANGIFYTAKNPIIEDASYPVTLFGNYNSSEVELTSQITKIDYESGTIYTNLTVDVDTTVTAEITGPASDYKSFQTENYPIKDSSPVSYDIYYTSGSLTHITPASVKLSSGIFYLSTADAATIKAFLEASASNHVYIDYTYVDSVEIAEYMTDEPLVALYTWAETIKVDYQYVNGDAPIDYRYPVAHKGRIFACSAGQESLSSVYWSDITETGSEYQSWPPVNFDTFREGDGDCCTCLLSMSGELFIFKTRSIHRYRGTDITDFRQEVCEGNVGCAGPLAACVDSSTIYFVSDKGLYSFDGMSAKNLTRDRIPALWARINKPYLSQAVAYPWDGLVLFALPLDTSTVNDFVLVYDTSTGAFWPWDEMDIAAWSEISTTSGTKLYSGHVSEGYVLEQDAGTDDDGTNISSYFELPTIDIGVPDKQKKARYVYVEHGEDQTTWATVKAFKDYATALELTARNADKAMRKYAIRPTITGKWRYFGVRVEHDQAGEFEVRSVLIPYKVKDKSSVKGAVT